MMRTRIAAVIVFSGLILLAGCSTGHGEGGPCEGDACAGTTRIQEGTGPTESGERTTEDGATVFFPTIPTQDAVPLAIAQGRLVLSESGCLLIKNAADPPDSRGLVPVWPSDYEPDARTVRCVSGTQGGGWSRRWARGYSWAVARSERRRLGATV